MRKEFILVVFFVLNACAHSGKSSKSSEVKISDKHNSVYYYLVSELKGWEGNSELASSYLDKALQKAPSSAHLAVKKGYELARQGHYDQALEVAQKAEAGNPDDVDLNLLLGKLYSSQRQADKAFIHYEKALQLSPDNPDIYSLLASEYLAANKLDQAVDTLKRWMERELPQAPAHFMLGSIYATQFKNYAKAAKEYEAVLEEEPGNPKAQQVLVEVYLAQKNFNKALDLLRRSVQQNPGDIATRIRIGVLLYEEGHMADAIKEFEAILAIKPDDDKILYYLGLLNEESKNDDKAVIYYDRISTKSEFFGEGIVRQVVIFKRQDKLAEAHVWLDAKIKDNPDIIALYQTKSSLLAYQKKYDEAVLVLKQGLTKRPNNEDLLMSLGMMYENMKEREKAVATMRQVIAVDDTNATALNYVGYSYAEKGERLDEAEALIKKALAVKPDDALVMDSLGWVYYQKKDYKQALEILEKAINNNPKEPTIQEHAGDACLALQDKNKARMYYEKALNLLRASDDLDDDEKEQVTRLVGKLSRL